MKRTQCKWYPTASAILIALILRSTAGVLLEEGFQYPNGPIVGAPNSPWNAHSAAGNGPVLIQDEQLELASDRAEDIHAPLSGAPYAAEGSFPALYAAMTLRLSALPSARGTYFAHFRNNTTAHRGRIWISQSKTVANGFRLGIGNSGGASADSGPWPEELAPHTAYRVVIRYQLATGLSTLWVNPNAETDPGVTATDTPSPIDISTFAFRQSSDLGLLVLDDLRVADSFAEAVSAAVRLGVIQTGAEVQVSWPETAEGYVLEQTTDLAQPQWTAAGASPVLENGRYIWRLPILESQQYFRLIKP